MTPPSVLRTVSAVTSHLSCSIPLRKLSAAAAYASRPPPPSTSASHWYATAIASVVSMSSSAAAATPQPASATPKTAMAKPRMTFIRPPLSSLPRLPRRRGLDAALGEHFAQKVLHLAIDRTQLRLREPLDLRPQLGIDSQQVGLALAHRTLRCRASPC